MSTDRHLDPRWNACLFQLCQAWNRLGPDRALDAMKVLASSQVTAEGVVVLEITAAGEAALDSERHRVRPAGTCSGCGETRALRGDGTVQRHRLWTSGSSAECSGSTRPPAGDAATGTEG